MGGAYISNAGVFLVDTLFSLYIFAVLLRFVLQVVRADFYNPLSQAIVTVTNPPLRPLRRYVPSIGGVDTSCLLLMVALQMTNNTLIALMLGAGVSFMPLLVITIAELLSKVIYLFIFAILIQVVLSWVAAGTHNPITGLINAITTPLMRPARRILPPLGGLDLSPLIVIVGLQLILILIIAPIRDFARVLY